MVGQQIQLGATIADATGNVITGSVFVWTSSDTTVATVDSTGLVMALAMGKAEIIATSEAQRGAATISTTKGFSFAMVRAGGAHTCGVTSDGTAYCWGDNSSGQLGNGTLTNTATPAPVAGGLSFSTVSTGDKHTCGVTSGGTTYCWGDNSSGQLGNGTTTSSVIPVPVPGGLSFVLVSAGGKHTCGVTNSGQAYCWGDNSFGQLGNGTLASSAVPALVSGGLTFATEALNFTGKLLSAGGSHTCGKTNGGDPLNPYFPYLYCWGNNSSGQLGNGTLTNSPVPVAISSSWREWFDLSAGSTHTCAVTQAGTFGSFIEDFCWGDNGSGQLGDGTTMSSATPVPFFGSGLIGLYVVSAGTLYSCAAGSYHASCWGNNGVGQLGNGTMTNNTTPTNVSGGLNFASVSTGGRHACGIIGTLSFPSAPGAGYCWGDNTFGQLGNTWSSSSSVPINVAGQP
jgi:alpha-tubulin suppressor-like RCC1 family protein